MDLDGWIERTKEILNRPSVMPVRTKQCTALRRCNYYSVCFDESNEQTTRFYSLQPISISWMRMNVVFVIFMSCH